jgi:IK cytokine
MPQDDIGEEPSTQRLTNDDFRKLLMTPAANSTSSIRETIANSSGSSAPKVPSTERHEARRKKKNFYAQLKKQEDTKLAELAEKYRDRARERRDGANPDYLVS